MQTTVIEVRVFANPFLERSVVTTNLHRMGDEIQVSAGALKVLDRGKVIKAYGVGHWIDAEVTSRPL